MSSLYGNTRLCESKAPFILVQVLLLLKFIHILKNLCGELNSSAFANLGEGRRLGYRVVDISKKV